MLRILYDDFDQKVKNIHDKMDLHLSYKKKSVSPVESNYNALRILYTYLELCFNVLKILPWDQVYCGQIYDVKNILSSLIGFFLK